MQAQQLNVSLKITTNAYDGVAFQMFIDCYALDASMGALCGGIILVLLNFLIISEVKPSHFSEYSISQLSLALATEICSKLY